MKTYSVNELIQKVKDINNDKLDHLKASSYNLVLSSYWRGHELENDAFFVLKICDKPAYIRSCSILEQYPNAKDMCRLLAEKAAKRENYNSVLLIWEPFNLKVHEYPFRVDNFHTF